MAETRLSITPPAAQAPDGYQTHPTITAMAGLFFIFQRI
jgi:hypothetical protein